MQRPEGSDILKHLSSKVPMLNTVPLFIEVNYYEHLNNATVRQKRKKIIQMPHFLLTFNAIVHNKAE